MKKLFFTAIACVAFAFNGLASNEVVENTNDRIEEPNDTKRPCKIYVKTINSEGKEEDKIGEGGNLSWEDCGAYKNKYLQQLKDEKHTFTEDDIYVTWG